MMVVINLDLIVLINQSLDNLQGVEWDFIFKLWMEIWAWIPTLIHTLTNPVLAAEVEDIMILCLSLAEVF